MRRLLALLPALCCACASPLGRAAAAGDVPQVKRLIDSGASLDAADADARTPLMRAAQAGQAAAIMALCDAGADPSLGTRSGTPLETAARYGRLESARALIECGARPTARAREIADSAGYPAVASAIGEAVAPPVDPDGPPTKPGATVSHGNLDPDAFQRMLDSSQRNKGR